MRLLWFRFRFLSWLWFEKLADVCLSQGLVQFFAHSLSQLFEPLGAESLFGFSF